MAKNIESFVGSLIIDFDSTFIKLEALDELANLVLQHNPHRSQILAEIVSITNLGMAGSITFTESLQRRLSLFTPNAAEISQLIALLKQSISLSFEKNKGWFRTHASQIYIISGGFQEYIIPVAAEYGILPHHVFANNFTTDSTGKILSFDSSNLLSQARGKSLVVDTIQLDSPVYVIGDGFTDYQITLDHPDFQFIAYTENIARPSVTEKAKLTASNWDTVIDIITNI